MVADIRGLKEGPILGGWTVLFKAVVDEHDAMSDEAVIADRDEFANEGMGLDTSIGADVGVALNFDEWSYEGVVANRAAVEIDRLDYGYIFAEANVFDLSGMNVRLVVHGKVPLFTKVRSYR